MSTIFSQVYQKYTMMVYSPPGAMKIGASTCEDQASRVAWDTQSVNTGGDRRVYAGLRSDIIIGALRLEQSFSEKDLADQYQTSRTPVREAAVRLQVEGLGSIIPNRGYFVTNLTIKEMNDLYAYRAAVESACVELLCDARLQPKAMASLGEVACFRADSDGKFADFIRADTDFHVGLARLSNNMLMLRTIAQLRSLTERISFAAEEAIEVRYYGEVPANNTRRFCKLFVATVPNSLVA